MTLFSWLTTHMTACLRGFCKTAVFPFVVACVEKHSTSPFQSCSVVDVHQFFCSLVVCVGRALHHPLSVCAQSCFDVSFPPVVHAGVVFGRPHVSCLDPKLTDATRYTTRVCFYKKQGVGWPTPLTTYINLHVAFRMHQMTSESQMTPAPTSFDICCRWLVRSTGRSIPAATPVLTSR